MTRQTRQERLRDDFQSMQELNKASTILDFQTNGDPPDRYRLTFRGTGISRDVTVGGEIVLVESHECELRLPYSYPERPPDIRWLSPIFHPNISFSGFINLRDLGLPWEEALTLDVVCERLWDAARLAYVDFEKASNYAARQWFEEQSALKLPTDERPLRDAWTPSGSNVIRYQRRGEGGRQVTLPNAAGSAEVLFIGEDTPTPPLPSPDTSLPRRRRQDDNDEDVFYIGDDS